MTGSRMKGSRSRQELSKRNSCWSILFGLLIAIVGTSGAGAGPKSVYECQVFAHHSLDHNFQNIAWGCGIPTNPATGNWTGTWQENFDLCRRSDADDIDKVFNRRSHRMNMCKNVCPAYADAAAGDVKAAIDNGCPLPNVPGRFEGNRKLHFDWCVSGVSEEVIGREWRERYAFTSKCVLCSGYAKKTAQQSVQNAAGKCGGLGAGWSIHPKDHYDACMNTRERVKEWAEHWQNYRHNYLVSCPSQEEQAFCSRHADRAIKQRRVLEAKKEIGKCNPKSLSSQSGWNDVYKLCLEQSRAISVSQETARDQLVKDCESSWRPSPPSQPLPPGAECNVSVETRLTSCTNADGTPTSNWDYTGLDPACGLGADEEQAKQKAIEAYTQIGIAVSDDPQPGQCGYSSETINGCGCPSGLGMRSYPGGEAAIPGVTPTQSPDILENKKAPPIAVGAPNDFGDYVEKSSPVAVCKGGMVLDVTNRCACPAAMVWRGTSCVDLVRSDACPPGTHGIYPNCRLLAVPSQTRGDGQCPDGFHGTPPNCCPRGTEYRDGACRAIARSSSPQSTGDSGRCPDGLQGTPPSCCPRGTEYRDGACRSVKTETPRCPPDRPIGAPPNCCPRGTAFIDGVCMRPAQRRGSPGEFMACPPGTFGTYPACCPPGTVYTGSVCLRKAKPSPRPSSPAPSPAGQPPPPPASDQGLPPVQKIPKGPVTAPPDGGLPPLKLQCPKGEARNATGQCVPQGPN